MQRRSILRSMALVTLPSLACALSAQPLLCVSGRIGRVNNEATATYDFSEAEFLKLATTRITTGTPWTPTSVFVGPLLADVMRAAGVTSGMLTLKALDDNSAPIPWDDLVRYGVILAHTQDGQRLNNKRWGPLWTIYPRDQNSAALRGPIAESRFIWQVNRIEANG